MRFLRLGSTRRVAGLLVGVAALAVVLAMVASAASGGKGQAPPAKSLAQAIHDALGGPAITGVSARVTFTNNLLGGMTTDQSSALLKGGSGRLWAAPGKLRIELQSDNGDAQVVYADGKGFVYDGPANTAYTFTARAMQGHKGKDNGTVPTVAAIEKRIARAEQRVAIAGPTPEVAAGQPAYDVRITPKQSGGLVGAAQLAWDAARGVPLKFALYARGQSQPALQLTVTDTSYGSVDPSVFSLSPPAGAKVVDLGGGTAGPGQPSGNAKQAKPGFTAVDPSTLGTRARRAVKQAGDGYLVLYGKGLDTVAVFEHQAKAGRQAPSAPSPNGRGPLELPSTTINGAKATALGTPLGGVVRFERGGISYTVVGSQPLSVLETAARGL